MFNSLRQSMSWLHTWSGLLLSWLLYFIFITGTLGYFDHEIDRWMKPEVPYEPILHDYPQAINAAQTLLNQEGQGADSWYFTLPEPRNPYLLVEWHGANHGEALFSLDGDRLQHRATGGGQWLYEMHFRLHYLPIKLAYWIVCIASVAMLVALISGVIIHKKIFVDFFTFRAKKGARSWLDFHNLLSVSALPFHLMITYSGLLFLSSTYTPQIYNVAYPAAQPGYSAFSDEFFGPSHPEASGKHAPPVDLNRILADAAGEWGTHAVRLASVHRPNDRNSTVRLIRMIGPDIARSERLYYDAATGQRLDYQPTKGAGKDVRMTLVNLHEGLFAGSLLRWLYFFSGLAGAAMIATGLVLWVKKRSNKKPASAQNYGPNTIARLNNGFLLGPLTAIAGYFWINRVVPAGWADRVSIEQNGFFVILSLAIIYSALQQPRRGTQHLLLINGLLFGLLPLACEGFGGGGLISSAIAGDLTLLGFNFVLLATALLSLVGWIKLRPDNELHLSRSQPS